MRCAGALALYLLSHVYVGHKVGPNQLQRNDPSKVRTSETLLICTFCTLLFLVLPFASSLLVDPMPSAVLSFVDPCLSFCCLLCSVPRWGPDERARQLLGHGRPGRELPHSRSHSELRTDRRSDVDACLFVFCVHASMRAFALPHFWPRAACCAARPIVDFSHFSL